MEYRWEAGLCLLQGWGFCWQGVNRVTLREQREREWDTSSFVSRAAGNENTGEISIASRKIRRNAMEGLELLKLYHIKDRSD